MTLPLLPGEVPGQCFSCGKADRPVTNGRCTLCEACWGPASTPTHIWVILGTVLDDIEDRMLLARRPR